MTIVLRCVEQNVLYTQTLHMSFLFIYVFIVVGAVACCYHSGCCFYGYYCYSQISPLWHPMVYRTTRIALWWIDLQLPFVRLGYACIRRTHNGGIEMSRDTIMVFVQSSCLSCHYHHLLSIIYIPPCHHKSPMSWRLPEHVLHWEYYRILERRHGWV